MKFRANNTISYMIKLRKKGIPIIPKLIYFSNRIIFSCDIPPDVDADATVNYSHNALGIVINSSAKIGSGTKIMQHVTIGGNMGKKSVYQGKEIEAPIIGNNVLIGAGATVIGPIVVGDNSIIAAGAVVTRDVDSNSTVGGIPAKTISK